MIGDKLTKIAAEQAEVFGKVDEEQAARLVSMILEAKAVYCAGVGRSGYMIRAFCMRLMHLGLRAYMVGDTEAPGAAAGDLLIVGSGSGETESLKAYAGKAKKLGMKLAAVTGFSGSALGRMADAVLVIPAPSPKVQGGPASSQPMANLFEQSLLVVLDAVTIEIMEQKGMDSDAMFANHANLE